MRRVPGVRRCRLHHRLDDFGKWRTVLRLIERRGRRGSTVAALKQALEHVWSPTSSSKYSVENPALGQCSVTAIAHRPENRTRFSKSSMRRFKELQRPLRV
ncbi:YunG family protein [Sinorhizobium alkalisoli]|uniref:YunG family protein n=1 Tax=Sinorhizobium alkalisoli TaxID=1752398 RepID=UPI003CC9E7E4